MKKANIFGLIVILCIAGYFGWQWQQTRAFNAKILPFFRNAESLEQDLNNVIAKGGRYVDLMDESKRVSKMTKEIKAKISEIETTTAESAETKASFIDMLTFQIDRADSWLLYWQSDLTTKVQESYLEKTNNDPFIKQYSGQYIAEAEKKRDEASLSRLLAKNNTDKATEKYNFEKQKIASILSINGVQSEKK